MIDWKFIDLLEGPTRFGYVPDPEHSVSGVTIGSGVDLGGRRVEDLPLPVREKLAPYVGLKGWDGVNKLKAAPLELTTDEVALLDAWARDGAVGLLKAHYDAKALTKFDDLSDALQTVIASVTFQYGSPWERTPNFWATALTGNTAALEHDLRHFGDRYTTRHGREADYLHAARFGKA